MAIPSLFVHYENALRPQGGGVQLCTYEYYETLKASGFELNSVALSNDMRPWTRLRRNLHHEPYRFQLNISSAVANICDMVESKGVEFVFLNQSDLRPLAKHLKSKYNSLSVIYLSHGLKSVDYLHELRARARLNDHDMDEDVRRKEKRILAEQLIRECDQSQHLDHVLCLSSLEAEIERWLGASNITYIPRQITKSPLEWSPIAGRLGYVGTLDHPPNKEGLLLLLNALNRRSHDKLHVRLVGSPRRLGTKIAEQYPFVEYLGRLDDNQLRQEAKTWACFLHPVFCYAMGASTKLAVAIGWEIPIISTTMGCRGYEWDRGEIPTSNTPDGLADLAMNVTNHSTNMNIKKEIEFVRQSSPDLDDISNLIRDNLIPVK